MRTPITYVTGSDFYKLFQCPHWPYYDRFATDVERSSMRIMGDPEVMRLEHGIAREEEFVRSVFAQEVSVVPLVDSPEQAFEQTVALMRQGAELIYGGTLISDQWLAKPDVLEKRTGASVFGDWLYVPVDVKSSHAIEKYQKLQLTFYASILEKIQDHFPPEAAIINRDKERLLYVTAENILEFKEVAKELERICSGEKPEPVLRKSCFDTGPWGVVCQRFAEATNDIALLSNLDIKKLRALRELGVRTVKDAAEMDIDALDGAAPGLKRHGLEVARFQARALLYGQVTVREAVQLPSVGLEIHFDIESDPPSDVDYMYGFLLRDGQGDTYRAFTALNLTDEGQMWSEFLAWIETLPVEYSVYHYSPYEVSRLGILAKRYGGSEALTHFLERMIDLKEIATSSIVFPLYFYGLKYIAGFLGYAWQGDVKAGGQSIDVFEKYLETKDQTYFDSILLYNEGDVRATAVLKDWLVTYAQATQTYEAPYPWTGTKNPFV